MGPRVVASRNLTSIQPSWPFSPVRLRACVRAHTERTFRPCDRPTQTSGSISIPDYVRLCEEPLQCAGRSRNARSPRLPGVAQNHLRPSPNDGDFPRHQGVSPIGINMRAPLRSQLSAVEPVLETARGE
ncbi:hypothetical protein MRX96_006806 [Rhipicephalus microplus]